MGIHRDTLSSGLSSFGTKEPFKVPANLSPPHVDISLKVGVGLQRKVLLKCVNKGSPPGAIAAWSFGRYVLQGTNSVLGSAPDSCTEGSFKVKALWSDHLSGLFFSTSPSGKKLDKT